MTCECVDSLLVTCRHSEPSFFWSGGCKRQVKMEGRCTHSLPVFANLCWPAVYNLNTVRVLAAVCGGYHVQRWHRTSHMTQDPRHTNTSNGITHFLESCRAPSFGCNSSTMTCTGDMVGHNSQNPSYTMQGCQVSLLH